MHYKPYPIRCLTLSGGQYTPFSLLSIGDSPIRARVVYLIVKTYSPLIYKKFRLRYYGIIGYQIKGKTAVRELLGDRVFHEGDF